MNQTITSTEMLSKLPQAEIVATAKLLLTESVTPDLWRVARMLDQYSRVGVTYTDWRGWLALNERPLRQW